MIAGLQRQLLFNAGRPAWKAMHVAVY